MFDPTPELPNDTLFIVVRFPAIRRNALMSSGFKTIGDIRMTPNGELERTTRIGKEGLAAGQLIGHRS